MNYYRNRKPWVLQWTKNFQNIFKQEGKLHTCSGLLNPLKKILEKISEFFLMILVCITESWDAFATFTFKISFSISSLETVFKENGVFRDFSRLVLMLRWFLYFITRFSDGSSELTLFTDRSSYFGIFNLATILEKNLLKIWIQFWILARILF